MPNLPNDPPIAPPSFVTSSLNLLDPRQGAKVIFSTDEWFATADNLLSTHEPEFDPLAFVSEGKLMDGWESRRRRGGGHDWCVMKLGFPGKVLGLEVDTAWFTGNYAPRVSIQAADLSKDKCDSDEWIYGGAERNANNGGVRGTCVSPEGMKKAEHDVATAGVWRDLLPMTKMVTGAQDGSGKSRQYFEVKRGGSMKRCTHIRFNYFPDGGVARLKVWGHVVKDFKADLFCAAGGSAGVLELSSQNNGGLGLACSNQHFGVPSNLLREETGKDMGDGWETARHLSRPPLMVTNEETGLADTDLKDWAVLRMGCVVGDVERLVLDTKFFKGNYPESVTVEYCNQPDMDPKRVCKAPGDDDETGWKPLLKRTRMGPDQVHEFTNKDLGSGNSGVIGNITHLRLSIFPDGGVSRVRLYGKAVAPIEDAGNEDGVTKSKY